MKPTVRPDPIRITHVPFLDLTVTPMTASETNEFLTSGRDKRLLLNHNLHSAYLHVTDESFRRIYAVADRIVIDGAPILWLSRRRDPSLNSAHRIGSTDWVEQLAKTKAPKTIALLGAVESSNRRAVSKLHHELSPQGWRVLGLHGYTPAPDMVAWLTEKKPDVVLVGLGMPRQEQFLLEHWDALPAAAYATVGGAIDYIAGANALAPRWVGKIGMEWAWRLAHEPRRLSGRYLVEPLRLVVAVIRRKRAEKRK